MVDSPIVILQCREPSMTITLRPGETKSVGRDASCDVVISDPRVARRQSILRHSGDTVTVQDADSPSGTLVNGAQIRGPTALRAGDQVRVGGLMFEVKYASAAG